MPVISVTRLRVRSWRYLPAFLFLALRSSRQARRANGNRGTRLLAEAHRTFWTLTTWADEAAMRTFMTAGPHGSAMRKLKHWCDEASVVHWSDDGSGAPTWSEAHLRMQSQGRRSKVLYPSADHEAFSIPPPVVRPGA